jgi:hypothetical protein
VERTLPSKSARDTRSIVGLYTVVERVPRWPLYASRRVDLVTRACRRNDRAETLPPPSHSAATLCSRSKASPERDLRRRLIAIISCHTELSQKFGRRLAAGGPLSFCIDGDAGPPGSHWRSAALSMYQRLQALGTGCAVAPWRLSRLIKPCVQQPFVRNDIFRLLEAHSPTFGISERQIRETWLTRR